MRLNIMLSALLLIASSASAYAEDWSGYPVSGGVFPPGEEMVPKTSLLGTEGVAVTCNDTGFEFAPACNNGPSHYEFAYVSLSAFARADRLDAVTSTVNALSTQLSDTAQSISAIKIAAVEYRRQVDGNLAASASLVNLTPSAPGLTAVHLGFGYQGDQSAFGFTATHRLNVSLPLTLDGGVAVSSSSDVTARAGIGIEF